MTGREKEREREHRTAQTNKRKRERGRFKLLQPGLTAASYSWRTRRPGIDFIPIYCPT